MSRRSERKQRRKKRSEPSLKTYLKEAFKWRWNLLAFGGAIAATILAPGELSQPAFMMVMAAELVYLAGLVSIPRFRTAIDAKHAAEKYDNKQQARTQRNSLSAMLNGLGPESRRRFVSLRTRILEMKRLAKRVQGKHERTPDDDMLTDLQNPSLNKLLWVFLRLLYSQAALRRFLTATDANAIEARIKKLEGQLAEHKDDADDRISRSLQDSLATAQLRLGNYRKAEHNSKFVAIELDRIEGKIQALTEMSVSHGDPNFISSEVDTVVASMQQTESAINDLNFITGMSDSFEETPEILESDFEEKVFAG